MRSWTSMDVGFAFLEVASPLHDAEGAGWLSDGVRQALEGLGGAAVSDPAEAAGRALFIVVATGGTEERVLAAVAARPEEASEQPLWLVAGPANNSLPAALEALARLQQEGVPARAFYLAGPEDAAGLRAIQWAAHDHEVMRSLGAARIGLVGGASSWLVASSPSPGVVRKAWGAEVVPLPMRLLHEAMDRVDDTAVSRLAGQVLGAAADMREPDERALRDAARVALGLRAMVAEQGLSAVTVRCFDLLGERGTTGCLALAELNDQGVVAACEGDLPSTLGMLFGRLVLDVTPWMANPVRADEAKDLLWLAHCTIPRAFVRSYELRSHFESGQGVAIAGLPFLGPVTLLRVGGTDLKSLWVAEGELLRGGADEGQCRTQVEVRLEEGQVAELLRHPLGNHLVMVPGHAAERLRSFWETAA